MPDAPLRVLFFTYSLGGGGAEMHLLRLVNHIDPARIEPVVAVARGGGEYESKLRSSIPLHHVGLPRPPSSNLGLLGSAPALWALLGRVDPHLVCGVLEAPTIVLYLTSRMRPEKVPCVSLVQNALSELYAPRRSLARECIFRGVRATYSRLDRIVAISDGVAQDIVRMLPKAAHRVERIYNAAVEPMSASGLPPRTDDFRHGDGRWILACGRLVPQKDYPTLLRALVHARRRIHDLNLAILGVGPLEGELRALAASLEIYEHVNFLGFKTAPARYMKAADAFVLSSRHEGFGNVIVEAMAAGTPVVATACPHGPEEIIVDGESGLLVPVGDPEGLADAVVRVLSDSGLRKRLIRRGATRAQEFSADKIAAQYATMFEGVAAQAASASPSAD